MTLHKRPCGQLLSQIGLAEGDAGGTISIHGEEPVVPSRHRLGTASAVALAAQGTAIAAIWRQRSGRGQNVDVDLAQAAVPGLCTSDHLSQSGHPVDRGRNPAMAANFFATKDGRRLYILRAPVYVPHMLRLLDFLGCANTTEAIAAATARWRADELEEALAERKIVGTIARTREEWLAHPQGQWLAARPPVEIEKIGDSPPEPFAPAARPLSGIRVLDMAHVLAGPVTSRVLAEQGADVLHVSAPHQPDQFVHLLDTGMGKRRAFIDLDRGGAAEVQALAGDADIFVQSWRPGSLERHGLSRRRTGAPSAGADLCHGELLRLWRPVGVARRLRADRPDRERARHRRRIARSADPRADLYAQRLCRPPILPRRERLARWCAGRAKAAAITSRRR